MVPAGQPHVGPSLVPGGQHFEPRGVSILAVPSGQPPQGFGVTVTVLVLALDGDAWTNVMLAPPKPLPANAAASTQTS